MSEHDDDAMPVLYRLDELVEVIGPRVFVRFSNGPDDDRDRRSHDYESGLDMSGLSVNPLCPEPWWTRPERAWLSRELVEEAKSVYEACFDVAEDST